MKKISKMRQLKIERRRLQERSHQLEQKLVQDWQQVQKSLRPASLLRDTWRAARDKSEEKSGGTIRSAVFAATTGFLLKSLLKKWRQRNS
jgi:hypothetical protein